MIDYLVAENIKTAYYQAGPTDAQPVLLVHGFASDYQLNWVGSGWEKSLVEAGFRVIGLDCRGHGSSDKPHQVEAYSISAMASDPLRLLDHLGLDSAHWVGYSMGSRITLEAALHHPRRVEKMVLAGVGTRVLSDKAVKAQLIAQRLRGDTTVTDPQAQLFFSFASSRNHNDLQALAAAIIGHQSSISSEQISSLTQPTLVIAGDQDELAIDAAQLAELIPGAQHISIPGRNHMSAVPARPGKEAAVKFLKG